MATQTARGPNTGQNGVVAPPGVKALAPGILQPCSHPPVLQKPGPQDAPGAGVRTCRGQGRGRGGQRCSWEKQPVHKRAVSRVYFGREEIFPSLVTDNARPCKRAHSKRRVSK